jgi:hypothetical protein
MLWKTLFLAPQFVYTCTHTNFVESFCMPLSRLWENVSSNNLKSYILTYASSRNNHWKEKWKILLQQEYEQKYDWGQMHDRTWLNGRDIVMFSYMYIMGIDHIHTALPSRLFSHFLFFPFLFPIIHHKKGVLSYFYNQENNIFAINHMYFLITV